MSTYRFCRLFRLQVKNNRSKSIVRSYNRKLYLLNQEAIEMSTVLESKKDRINNLKIIADGVLLKDQGEIKQCSKDNELGAQKCKECVDETATEFTSNQEKDEEQVKTESVNADILPREQKKIKECSEKSVIAEQKCEECMDHKTQELTRDLNLEKDKLNEITTKNGNVPKDQNTNINGKHVDRRHRKFAIETLEKKEVVEEGYIEEKNSRERIDRSQNRSKNELLDNNETKSEHVEEKDKKEKSRKHKDRRQNRFENERSGNKESNAEHVEERDEEEFHFFWKSESPFSQWHRSRFTVGKLTFECAEQYMMHEKAALFDDWKVARDIMKERDPRKQKSLGRKVQNFNQKIWDDNCLEIVKRGNMEKFSQNQKLYDYMISTHPKTLVEASPYDRIWGIGLTEYDEEAHNRKTWRGKNLLGQALTEVRNQLIEKQLMEQADTPNEVGDETGEGLHDKTEVGNQETEQTDSLSEVGGEIREGLHDETEQTDSLSEVGSEIREGLHDETEVGNKLTEQADLQSEVKHDSVENSNEENVEIRETIQHESPVSIADKSCTSSIIEVTHM